MNGELTEAVTFLRARQAAVQSQIDDLTVALRKIDRAIDALGEVPATSAGEAPQPLAPEALVEDDDDAFGDEAERGIESETERTEETKLPSVRSLVQQLIESEPRPYGNDEIQAYVRVARPGDNRPDSKLRGTIRTALWTLRSGGFLTTDAEGLHTATKWHTDTEAPAATRASGTAPASGLGGDDHEAHQDHRDNLSRRNGDRGGGAPVGATTLSI